MKKHIDEVRKEASMLPFKVTQCKTDKDICITLWSKDGDYLADFYSGFVGSELVGEMTAVSTVSLITHCLNTHQMILDALKDAEAFLRLRNLGANADKLNCSVIRPAIEAAENVEVSE